MIKKLRKNGFTLIELLMVIAIIGILAGILIPAVGSVKKQANVSASKAQISNYINAIELFKSEYKYYPFVDSATANQEEISLASDSLEFIQTLSARDPSSSSNPKIAEGGNRRQISFISFAESDFYVDVNDDVSADQLADRFNNRNIVIVIDSDGNGRVSVPDSSGSGTKTVNSPVTAYVEEDDEINAPAYYLYD